MLSGEKLGVGSQAGSSQVPGPLQLCWSPRRWDAFQRYAVTTNQTTHLLCGGLRLSEQGYVYMGLGPLGFVFPFARLEGKVNMLIWSCLSFPMLGFAPPEGSSLKAASI